MFLYENSKLEADTEQLQRQIAVLNKKLYEKDIALQALYQVCKEFLHNNIENRQIIVMKNKPHLFYGTIPDIEFEKLETTKIDLSDYKILQEFIDRLDEVEKQLKGEE